MTNKNNIPAWQVNPRSKQTDPEIAQAYRDKSLRLIMLKFSAFTGYSWTSDSSLTIESLLADPRVGASYRKAKSVTIEPYPYHLEKKTRRGRNG